MEGITNRKDLQMEVKSSRFYLSLLCSGTQGFKLLLYKIYLLFLVFSSRTINVLEFPFWINKVVLF